MGRYGWEISGGMFAALYPALVTEETLRSNLRIVKGALSDPVGMTATVDQDLYGTDAYVGWMLFLEYLDRGLNRWAAKVVSHTATTITLDDMIPGAGTFWLLPATGLSAQQTRDAMKLAPTAGAPAAGSVDAHLDALALEATAQAVLLDTSTTLPALLTSTLASFVNTYSTDATTAGSITRRRGDSWTIVPAALGVLTGYTSLWLTIKRSHDDADSASVLHVKKNASGLLDGLLYLNGAASTSNLASITVTDALTGVISIAVDEAATKELAPGEYYYDIQTLISGNVSTPDSGTFTVTADVTRSVT